MRFWVGLVVCFQPYGYGTNFTGTTATITGLTPGTYEEWTVRAYDAGGNVSGFAPGIFVVNPVPTPASAVCRSPLYRPPAAFQFTVQASAVQTTLIQATTNLADPIVLGDHRDQSAQAAHSPSRTPMPACFQRGSTGWQARSHGLRVEG